MVGKGRAPGIEPGAVGGLGGDKRSFARGLDNGLGLCPLVSVDCVGNVAEDSAGTAPSLVRCVQSGDVQSVFVNRHEHAGLVSGRREVKAVLGAGLLLDQDGHGVVWLVVVVALLASMWGT